MNDHICWIDDTLCDECGGKVVAAQGFSHVFMDHPGAVSAIICGPFLGVVIGVFIGWRTQGCVVLPH